MNAHDLARELLAGPDLPVVVAKGELGDREEVDFVDEFIPELGLQKWWPSGMAAPRDDPAVELR
jgi:hypothetical protein